MFEGCFARRRRHAPEGPGPRAIITINRIATITITINRTAAITINRIATITITINRTAIIIIKIIAINRIAQSYGATSEPESGKATRSVFMISNRKIAN